MKLSFKEIESVAYGVDRCEEKENAVVFHRFSKEQEELYKTDAPDLYNKVFAASGVSIRFITDSTKLKLAVDTGIGSSRTYFSHDIFVNGEYLDSLKNYTDDIKSEIYPVMKFSLGKAEKEFNLGDGKKEVKILFPPLVSSAVTSLELDDNSSFFEIQTKGEYLALGDSISQGYDSMYPKNKYTNILCDKFGLTEHNLAIGGEVYRPKLARMIKNNENIKLVTVAYGSNDWFHKTFEEAKKNCEEFLSIISDTFSGKKVFVISPIWRKDLNERTPFGDFRNTAKMIKDICYKYNNLFFIEGFNFVPEDTTLFGDGSLHPNDDGFFFYAESLYKEISKHLE